MGSRLLDLVDDSFHFLITEGDSLTSAVRVIDR